MPSIVLYVPQRLEALVEDREYPAAVNAAMSVTKRHSFWLVVNSIAKHQVEEQHFSRHQFSFDHALENFSG
jgi:hypothetical protein